ncbi:MAG: ABC transporter permease [Acidimicrobiales bacterium]
MTTLTLATPVRDRHYGLPNLIRSEWTKLVSVRSVRRTFAAFVVLTVGFGVLVCAVSGTRWSHYSASTRATWDPTNLSMIGFAFGDLLLPITALLMITGEYSSGSIRSTLCAAPRRWSVLAAKAAVAAGMALVAGEAVAFIGFLAGQAVLGPAPHASLADPTAVRAVVMTGAFVALMALFALGIGTIVRHSAGAVAAYVGLTVVLQALLSTLPGNVVRFAPETILSSSVSTVILPPHVLSPWVGMAMMALYAGISLVVGGVFLARRDH